jgi:mono/diheme cytochrome c family protein
MLKNAAMLTLFCVAGLFAFAQDNSKQEQKPPAPAEYKIPPEAVKEPNPVKPTAESIERGKRRWSYDCAMCHGADGSGKGDLAADMKLQLADYRDPKSLKDRTDGELFYIIKNGKGQMPDEGGRAKPDQIWDLVNYIRSLAKKGTPEPSKDQTP